MIRFKPGCVCCGRKKADILVTIQVDEHIAREYTGVSGIELLVIVPVCHQCTEKHDQQAVVNAAADFYLEQVRKNMAASPAKTLTRKLKSRINPAWFSDPGEN